MFLQGLSKCSHSSCWKRPAPGSVPVPPIAHNGTHLKCHISQQIPQHPNWPTGNLGQTTAAHRFQGYACIPNNASANEIVTVRGREPKREQKRTLAHFFGCEKRSFVKTGSRQARSHHDRERANSLLCCMRASIITLGAHQVWSKDYEGGNAAAGEHLAPRFAWQLTLPWG
jgi:hypothetical protein